VNVTVGQCNNTSIQSANYVIRF